MYEIYVEKSAGNLMWGITLNYKIFFSYCFKDSFFLFLYFTILL